MLELSEISHAHTCIDMSDTHAHDPDGSTASSAVKVLHTAQQRTVSSTLKYK